MPRTKQPDIEKIIRESIKTAMSEVPTLPCVAEKARIDAIEELSEKLSKIILGNGNPENGIVTKLTIVQRDVAAIETFAKERRSREWGMAMIGLGLIATSLWQILVP
jgi:hypothetical protein